MTPVLKASLWMTGTIVSFSVMAIAGREVATSLDTFETMLYRSVIGVVIVTGALSLLGRWHEITGQSLGIHVMRNLAHFIGQNLWFFAVTVAPLAQVFALEFTSPIWVMLLAALFLGERLTPMRVGASALGLLGVLIITRPWTEALSVGALAAAIAAVFFAATGIFTKYLARHQSVACILFYLTVLQLFMGLAAAGYDGDIALPDHASLPWLILIGLAGLMAHLCLTTALSLVPATLVYPIDFARLPTIAILGMLLYNEPIDILTFLGGLVILAAIYLSLKSKSSA